MGEEPYAGDLWAKANPALGSRIKGGRISGPKEPDDDSVPAILGAGCAFLFPIRNSEDTESESSGTVNEPAHDREE